MVKDKNEHEQYVLYSIKVSNAEIKRQLSVLKLEKGISINAFIVSAIAEKLRRNGYKI